MKLTILTAILASTFLRTYPAHLYEQDPARNSAHGFSVYENEVDYQELDFMSVQALPSPLYNPLYQSYDIIAVVNKTNLKIPGSEFVEPEQTIRVYAREQALNAIGLDQFQMTQSYNPDTGLLYFWKVSTARPGASTPSGFFRPQGFSSDHQSSIYNNAPMPWTIFFNGNIAFHGVRKGITMNPIKTLGKKASAGCVRLEPQRAEDLFHLIGLNGIGEVDQLDSLGKPVLDSDGNIKKVASYKTLIIIKD